MNNGERGRRGMPGPREGSAASAAAIKIAYVASDPQMAAVTRKCLRNASRRLKGAAARLSFHSAVARLYREPRIGGDPFNVLALNETAEGWAWPPREAESLRATFGLEVLVGVSRSRLGRTVTVVLGHEDGHRVVSISRAILLSN